MDFTPIIEHTMSIIAAVFLPVALYLAREAADWIGLELSASAEDTIERYVMRGVSAADQRLRREHGDVDVDWDERVQKAVEWVIEHTPKAMKRAGFGADDITDMVEQYLSSRGD